MTQLIHHENEVEVKKAEGKLKRKFEENQLLVISTNFLCVKEK